MPRTGLSAEQIRYRAIDATLEQMRMQGFDKVRLSGVAKELGVSHAALYAHFKDKAALLDAVTEQWLKELNARLIQVCDSTTTPVEKVVEWFITSYRLKRGKALSDPELYRALDVASALDKTHVREHLRNSEEQLVQLLRACGMYAADAVSHAEVLLQATLAFHHPKLLIEGAHEDREPLLLRILSVTLAPIKQA